MVALAPQMLSAKLVVALVLSQYARSRVKESDPESQCVWWKEDTTITYRQAIAGNPETPGETEFTAVAQAFTTWNTQLLACGNLRLTEGPRTTQKAVGFNEKSTDNQNIVIFRQRNCEDVAPAGDPCFGNSTCADLYDCWEHGKGALAITTTSFNPTTGRILDADIELNTPNFIFTTVDSPPCVPPVFDIRCVASDVQNTITHEAGHLLGLTHFASTGSTMNARAVPGETSKRTLDDGSKQFICDAYPSGRPTRTCRLPAYDGELGKPAPGCSSAGGLSVLAASLLLRRRRKTPRAQEPGRPPRPGTA